MKYQSFKNQKIKKVFSAYPENIKSNLLLIRELIFQITENHDEIGQIEEALKWGTPSYLTSRPKSGTTIRLSKQHEDDKFAISVHCQTTLMTEFKALYPDLEYDGNRSIIFNTNNKMPLTTIEHFLFSALTYHQRKKNNIGI